MLVGHMAPTGTLAARLRHFRERAGLSLDVVAEKAGISKTYLWELEKDTAGEKKPSADVLLRIAAALSVTIADLLDLPTVQVKQRKVELPRALRDFRERMVALHTPLSDDDVRDLALMRFRGRQPETADDWHQLYLALLNTSGRKRR
jgi:transcriptional regulator with XRE-family HTH domain